MNLYHVSELYFKKIKYQKCNNIFFANFSSHVDLPLRFVVNFYRIFLF